MKQEDKQLLLTDLCARLPWGVKCHINGDDTNTPRKLSRIEVDELDGNLLDFWTDREDLLSIQVYLSEVKPYLRPMSSMMEDEKKEYKKACDLDTEILSNHPMDGTTPFPILYHSQDYLNSIHVDYRGLIPMGLAIEVTEENNPYEK